MAKSKPKDLAERIHAVFEEDSRISKEAKDIENRKEMLDSAGKNLDDAIGYARKLMEKGVQLEDCFLDYAFYHHGSRANETIKSTKDFFTNFSKYSGQLILENKKGYSWENTTGKGYEERRVILGRLQQDTYDIEMPIRLVKARTDNLKIFETKKGWKDTKKELLLNDFIYEMGDIYSRIVGLPRMKSKDIGRSRPKGIYMDIFSPREEGRRFGGSITYDSEPHRSLIVGDEAVNHYLKKQKLEVITQSVSPVEIPKI